ncbi:MAG: PfkB family carbohydrate kinase [Tabrizicola sp.]
MPTETLPTVLVVGSLHHDIMVEADHLPRRDETAVGRRWYPKFGGKGGNQAVAVARAGAPCRMSGAVGDDGFGAFLRQGLQAGGVEDRFVQTLPGVGSGMSVAILDADGDYAATIVPGANLKADAAALAAPDLWRDVGLLILQNEVPEALNLAAAREARARGVRCLLNAAPARELSAELAGLVDLLVVNAVEAEMMGAGAVRSLADARAAAGSLALRFPAVIVTAGALGLAASEPGAGFTIPAEKVRVRSSHGAGDAFIGTLAAGLVRGLDLRAAAGAASRAAARHVSGAAPG